MNTLVALGAGRRPSSAVPRAVQARLRQRGWVVGGSDTNGNCFFSSLSRKCPPMCTRHCHVTPFNLCVSTLRTLCECAATNRARALPPAVLTQTRRWLLSLCWTLSAPPAITDTS